MNIQEKSCCVALAAMLLSGITLATTQPSGERTIDPEQPNGVFKSRNTGDVAPGGASDLQGMADESARHDLDPGDGEGAATPTGVDCNGNGIQDSTDIADGTSLDCNNNGVPDECDIGSGASLDTDGDGIPDECETTFPCGFSLLESNFEASDGGWTHAVTGAGADTWHRDIASCFGDPLPSTMFV